MQIHTVPAVRAIKGVDSFAVASEAPNGLRRRLPLARAGLQAFVCIGMVGAGLIGAADLLSRVADAKSVAPAPAPPAAMQAVEPSLPEQTFPEPRWIDVNRPIQLYELAGSAFGKLPLAYHARRRTSGSDRQDYLAYGTFGGDTPYLSLAVSRTGSPAQPDTGLFVDLARLAADQNLAVSHSGIPSAVSTRFGAFAVTDLTATLKQSARPCLGFRLQPDAGQAGSPVGIAGIACGTDTRPMDRASLACVLDRIDLVSAGDDSALQAFFVDAERRRGQQCSNPHMLAAGARETWLDSSVATPSLKRSPGHSRGLR